MEHAHKLCTHRFGEYGSAVHIKTEMWRFQIYPLLHTEEKKCFQAPKTPDPSGRIADKIQNLCVYC